MRSILRYALITPARDEDQFIRNTIKSVVAQTILPLKWVIVSDGSTDQTDQIAQEYCRLHDWIQLLRMPRRRQRDFSGKVSAFQAGWEHLRHLDFEIIGNLDADITVGPDHFEFLLERFKNDPKLGVAGTPFREDGVQYDYRFSRKEHVSGACQMFRRICYEQIGGYIPVRGGGIDLIAVVSARMKGWKTQTFTGKHCIHHRQMGTARNKIAIATLRSGYGDYCLGVHPIWHIFRSLYQMTRKPYLLSGILLMAGYLQAMLTQAPRPVSSEFVKFRGREQMRWLAGYFRFPKRRSILASGEAST